ncbi:hypothetical protein [Tenacibaculum larymnensis]|uniref:Uncharacterized protein n=1 Tax=Tenacibaculum larymnensis TaxID=2878201 RepID=A0A9X4ELF8_9FLAO|nr:hypothetical protein [Tenacibaculum larymnensis]MDE1206038.1 hypothetical protein [Tenacibaculum larymnensis]
MKKYLIISLVLLMSHCVMAQNKPSLDKYSLVEKLVVQIRENNIAKRAIYNKLIKARNEKVFEIHRLSIETLEHQNRLLKAKLEEIEKIIRHSKTNRNSAADNLS